MISMAIGRRHSRAEITAKLIEAGNLARQGMVQTKIAQTLGVSVMTLHRWRKRSLQRSSTGAADDEIARFAAELTEEDIAELRAENARLRRLATDLLLENLKLSERPPRGLTSTPSQSKKK
jgi:putative transposase